MQKSSQKGSILLWSIGISLILVFLFTSFSTRLSEKIRFEKGLVGGVQNIFQADSLNTLSGTTNITITQVQDDLESLQEGENKEYRIHGTNPVFISITLNKGGPIAYKFATFSGATLMGGVSSSGFTDNAATFTGFLNTSYDNGVLYIKNLGGYSSYFLTGSEAFTPTVLKYTVSQETAGENQIQRELCKPQFTNGEWGDLDYGKLDMEF